MTFARFSRLLGLAFFTAASATFAGAQTYIVTDLGTLGGTTSYAYGVSDSGIYVGASTKTTSSDFQAFSYSNGTQTGLGTLAGGLISEANAVNNSGTVVGDSATSGSGMAHAFAYVNGALVDMGTFGGSQSFAYGINSAGLATGYADVSAASGGGTHAFSYDTTKAGATKTDLGTLGGRASYGYGINASGAIVGYSSTTNNTASHAFIDAKDPMTGVATMTDIGTLNNGKGNSFGRGINKDGTAVGYSDTGVAGQQLAFAYTGAGGMQSLGTLAGTVNSRALGINDSGVIVGYSINASNATTAFVYANSAMVSLSAYSGISNWTFQYAASINNNGVIVGYGMNPQKQIHAFALTQVTPAPSSLLFAIVGAGGIGVAVRRKRK